MGKMARKDAGPVFPGFAIGNLGGGGAFDDGVKVLAIGEDEHSPGEALAFASKFPAEAELNEGGFVADLFDGMEGSGGVEDQGIGVLEKDGGGAAFGKNG